MDASGTGNDFQGLDIEQAIKMANREVLASSIGAVDQKQLIAFSIEVATRRAAYLRKAVTLCDPNGPHVSGDELQTLRTDYEESRAAFAELVRVIDRGYLG